MGIPPLNKYNLGYSEKQNAIGKYKGHTYEIETKKKMGTLYFKAIIDGRGGPETDWFTSATEAGNAARQLINQFGSHENANPWIKGKDGHEFYIKGHVFYFKDKNIYDERGEHIGQAPTLEAARRFIEQNIDDLI